ncbi:MAG: hypothetical protein ACP5NW_02345, partial [Candidatus Woesearchaeota archaeon]
MKNSLDNYLIKGRLAEDGQTMDFPILEDGNLVPLFRAGYHVHDDSRKDYHINENLVYLALPSGTSLEIGEKEIPIPFKVKGEIVDIKKFRMSPYSINTDGVTLAKIHPNTRYRVRADIGTSYHSFEMLRTPESYKNPNEMHLDFMLLPDSEKNKLEKNNAMSEWTALERGSRVIKLPGVVLYSENGAFRIPGWLAKEFNGSPEFGFAYAPFKEPRKGEVLHYHQEVMEPYMGLEGRIPLFVAMPDGSDRFNFIDKNGNKAFYNGEVFEIGKGDVLLPLSKIPHTIVFDERANFPFTQYCINYASKPLN